MPVVMTVTKYSKRDLLKNWMRQRHVFATHEVIHWGDQNFYNRAAQTKGDLVREGFLRRLEDLEKVMYGYKCKDEVYECSEY
jgi:hypothetical protein